MTNDANLMTPGKAFVPVGNFNECHDDKGQFCEGGGSGSGGINTPGSKVAKFRHSSARGYENEVKTFDNKPYGVMGKFPDTSMADKYVKSLKKQGIETKIVEGLPMRTTWKGSAGSGNVLMRSFIVYGHSTETEKMT